MIRAFGHAIPETIDELLREPCALVVSEMQSSIVKDVQSVATLIASVGSLRDAAHRRGSPVIYMQHFSPQFAFEDRAWIRSMHRRMGGDLHALQPPYPQGSAGWEIAAEVAPATGDLVLAKTRRSLFVGTPLQAVLAAMRVDTVVLTGVSTDRGILATAREAESRGLFVVVPQDGVGSFSEAGHAMGLEELRKVSDVCSTSDVLSIWGSGS